MNVPNLDEIVADEEALHGIELPPLPPLFIDDKDESFLESSQLMADIIASVYAMPAEKLAKALEGQVSWNYKPKKDQRFT